MTRYRIIFSGSGGQGIITAAKIIAEAAVLYEGLNSVQSQSYGAEARGGASRSDVIISDEEIYFTKVTQPNILVSLTQEAYNKFSPMIRPGGLLLTDSNYVKQEKKIDAKQVELNMYKTIMKILGKPLVFNICMLGALINLTQLIKPESIIKVLQNKIPDELLKINKEALEVGLDLAEKYKIKKLFNFKIC